jgi:hypothetical protein
VAVDIERVSGLAESYVRMQGLRIVPLGVPFAVSAAGRLGWLNWVGSPAVRANVWFLLFYAALACGYVIEKHYAKRYGSGSVRERGVPFLALVAAIFVVLLWLHRGPLRQFPVPPQTVFIGVLLLYVGVANQGLRWHYVPIGIAWLALASLEVVGVPDAVRSVMADVTVAASLIVGGICDHLVLARALAPHGETRYSDR